MNYVSAHLVIHHSLKDSNENLLVDQIMVYESLLLWTPAWTSILLTVLFVFVALLNVVFTAFIAYEQVTMF